MTKQKLLKPVNIVMTIDFLFLVGTALADDIIPRATYKIIHPLFGYIFFSCVVLHIFLNWNWIKNNIMKKTK